MQKLYYLAGVFTLILALAGSTHSEEQEFVYTVVTPSKISSQDGKLGVHVTLHSAKSFPVSFSFVLEDLTSGDKVAQGQASLKATGKEEVTLDLSKVKLFGDTYKLTVKAIPPSEKVVEDHIILNLEKKSKAIIVQSDKAVYKPGETVKFRVFLLSRFFLPLEATKNVTVTVYDSSHNVIKSFPKTAPLVIPAEKGFASQEFQLSTEPNLGNWKIQAEIPEEGERASLSFSVDQYVLPKYKVEFEVSPNFVTYNDSKTLVTVKAFYTHGKPVAAKCTLTLKEPFTYYLREGRIPSVSKTGKTVDGKASFELDVKKELAVFSDEVSKWGKVFNLEASCKDEASGNVRNATTTVTMYQHPYKIEMVERSARIRPGFPVNFTVKVTDQDGLPIGDENEKALKIEHGFDFTADGGVLYKSVPKNGLVNLQFVAPPNPKICYEAVEVTYKDVKENFWLPSKMVSETRSYMQVRVVTDRKEILEGSPVTLNVKTSRPMETLNAVVLSRGSIQASPLIKVDLKKDENSLLDTDVTVTLPELSYPKSTILLYTVFDNGDLIAEAVKLDVSPSPGKSVSLSVSPKTQEPFANVSISVKGNKKGKSYFGLRAVDQSVLLLRKDNDLSSDKLGSIAESFRPRANYWGGSDIFQIFVDNGVSIVTNCKLDKGQISYPSPPAMPMASKISSDAAYESMSFAGAAPNRVVGGFVSTPASVDSGAPQSAPPTVRSNFPETWIWEDFEATEGEARIEKGVPDTITSWFISAFQLGPQVELGLTKEPEKLTVFRPFFLGLNLPYSVVQGEELGLQVLVHNYLEDTVRATISLENKDNFFKVMEGSELSKVVEIKGSSISTVIFPIVPVKHGVMNLEVKGVSSQAGDAIKKSLIVKPPGIKHTQNSAVLVNLLKSGTFTAPNLTAIFPERRVKTADSVKVSVVGDILGGTMNNLNSLVKMPSGCGEQNMVNFVPNIVVLEYLEKTNQLTESIKRRATSYLERGYQQQLTYMRNDGSFSAFGKSDPVGSTWLTAFVTKSFLQARKYLTIDPKVIQRSLRFLQRQHNDNGSFSEDGFVYDKSLMGGANGEVALTAYVLLTFAEAEEASKEIPELGETFNSTLIHDGINFILKQKIEKDAYAVSIISYLLEKRKHADKEKFFGTLKELGREKEEEGTLHWEQVKGRRKAEGNHTMPFWRGYIDRVRPATVEITSYALLTHLARGDVDTSMKIGKWLLQQRNAEGGFISTQDTVVGIRALGQFAESIRTADSKAEVTVNYGPSSPHTFKVEDANRLELQEFILPLTEGDSKSISISATGKGSALAQLSWSYYVEQAGSERAFELRAEVTEKDKGRTLNMRLCTVYKGEGEVSNMALLQANAPSGYAFDQEELEEGRGAGLFKRYELENKDNRVSLYFQGLAKGEEKCLDMVAYRVYMVAKHVPGEVSIIDYYDNTQRGEVLYQVPPISLCDICKIEGDCEGITECKE